ncbi:peroxiredoxin [Sulfobacillus acidophilus DSM 10332]|uniref:Peroxiredoxin n=1 Tax=Sulfobacillus acidophilus (strain ATCC 700253 / DSM 10332 / NAL) TaxID=679936 RepID=G8TZC5_SULAD|nr:peroxiredoxin [Sulfobacillus acidophilus DSM 10332]
MDNSETLLAPSLPRLNEPAPDFEAMTTIGPIKLSDFRGKWVVMYSHPADFTPVCTTEFIGFADAQDELAGMNVQLLGLSIDSVFSHLAWVHAIQNKFGKHVPFPIIADIDMKVSRLYGMVHPAASTTQAVRALFIIDPEGILRLMMYYPMTTGRNIQEVIRVIKALQIADTYQVNTGANWRPGDPVIVSPPKTVDAMNTPREDLTCTDWYFCTKELPE